MTIADVWIILLAVHSLKIPDADHRPLKGRKIGKPSPLTLS